MLDSSDDLAFGRFLKYWRGVRNLSQEELAFQLNCSPRHISRLERNGGHPSEAIINDIACVLELGERDTNHLRISAGYMVKNTNAELSDPEYFWLRKSLVKNLVALDPYPTTISDSRSKIVMVNRGWVSFFQELVPPDKLEAEINVWGFIFDHAVDGSEDALSLIMMGLQHTALFTGDVADQETVDRLAVHDNLPGDWESRALRNQPRASFWIPLQFLGKVQNFLSMTSVVSGLGPNRYASAPYLMINTLYPEGEIPELDDNKQLTHPLLDY